MSEVNDRDVHDDLVIAINARSEKYKLTHKGGCVEYLLHTFYLEPDT